MKWLLALLAVFLIACSAELFATCTLDSNFLCEARASQDISDGQPGISIRIQRADPVVITAISSDDGACRLLTPQFYPFEFEENGDSNHYLACETIAKGSIPFSISFTENGVDKTAHGTVTIS